MARFLISLDPKWARATYQRRKQVEFRRVRMNVEPGDESVIYETHPVGRVTGYFHVKAMHYGTPNSL